MDLETSSGILFYRQSFIAIFLPLELPRAELPSQQIPTLNSSQARVSSYVPPRNNETMVDFKIYWQEVQHTNNSENTTSF